MGKQKIKGKNLKNSITNTGSAYSSQTLLEGMAVPLQSEFCLPQRLSGEQELRIKQPSMLIILLRHLRKVFIKVFLKWCLSAETFRFVLRTKKNRIKLIK